VPKKHRQAKIPTPAWDRPRGAIGSRVLGRGFQFYGAVVISMLIGLALAIVGYAFLADYLETQGRPGSTALQIDDTRYRLDHFTNRLKMYVDQNGGPGVVDQITALSQVPALLIQEEIVRRFAGEFDITASEEEILQEIAIRLGIAADDETFDVVFQQEKCSVLARESEGVYRIVPALTQRQRTGVQRGPAGHHVIHQVPNDVIR